MRFLYVIANFIETIDGVVSFRMPGHSDGGIGLRRG